MKNVFQNIVFNSIHISCDEFLQHYEADFKRFALEHPHAGQKIYNTILRQTYKNAALNIEGVLLARAIREALTKDETVKLEICDKIKADTAIQIEAILERMNKIDSGDSKSLSKPKNKPAPIVAQPLPDEWKEWPAYCKLTSLFAQGHISKKNKTYQLTEDNAAAPRLFPNGTDMAAYIKQKYAIEPQKSGLAQIIRDTLNNDKYSDANLFASKSKMINTYLYCEAHGLEVTEEFSKALEAVQQEKVKKSRGRYYY